MPVAVLIGGLVAIAFAFAAIAAALLMENLVISPLQGAQAAVSEVAVVGGVLAWMLGQLINFIRYSLAGVQGLVGGAEVQAADWWNYLVNQTVNSQYAYWWQHLSWLVGQEGWISWLESYVPALWSFTVNSLAPTVNAVGSLANRTAGYVYGSLAPWVGHIAAQLNYLQAFIDGYVVPRVNGIGNDLAGLRDWVARNAATHGEVASAEAQAVARAVAIAAPIAAVVAEIEDSPCMRYCSPLGDLGQLLQGLEDAGLFAIMLALIEEVRQNPQEVQTVLRDVFVPLVDDAASTVGLRP